MIDYNKLSVEYCQSQMMYYIANNSKINNLKEFIAMFSYFISINDASFYYNLPYLPNQYKKLGEFLKYAHEKWAILNALAERIKNENILNSLDNDKKIIISINDFLKLKCEKKSCRNIEFCEEPSVSSAKRKDSIFTIEYYDNDKKMLKTYLYQKTDDDKEEFEVNCTAIIAIIKNMLGMNENG